MRRYGSGVGLAEVLSKIMVAERNSGDQDTQGLTGIQKVWATPGPASTHEVLEAQRTSDQRKREATGKTEAQVLTNKTLPSPLPHQWPS